MDEMIIFYITLFLLFIVGCGALWMALQFRKYDTYKEGRDAFTEAIEKDIADIDKMIGIENKRIDNYVDEKLNDG